MLSFVFRLHKILSMKEMFLFVLFFFVFPLRSIMCTLHLSTEPQELSYRLSATENKHDQNATLLGDP